MLDSVEGYERLFQNDHSAMEDGSPHGKSVKRRLLRIVSRADWITLALAILCCITFTIIGIQTWYIMILKSDFADGSTGLIMAYDQRRVANSHSSFDSYNDTEADAAWAKIEAGHGDVALDPAWASSHGLHSSYKHPMDPSRSVYIIEAYHEIHCLKVLRDHYMRMYHSHRYVDTWPQPEDWNVQHDKHCFDSLRQHVMCHADDTLLYSMGHHDAGVSQVKMCRDWDRLRDWATRHSAGWKDHINPRPEGEYWWNFSDGGDDGLPYDSL